MSITVAGKRIVNGNIRVNVSPINGTMVRVEQTGTVPEVEGQLTRYPGASEIDYEQDGPIARIQATFVEQVSSNLEIDFEEVTGSIFKNPYFASIVPDRIQAIKTAADLAATIGIDEAIADQGLTALEIEAFEFLVGEITDYVWDVPEITWTRTVPQDYNAAVDISQMGKIFTTDQVVAIVGAPIIWSIPNTVFNIGVPDGFSLGWRMRIKVNFIANGGIQIIASFKFGAYANSLYTFA